VLVSGQKPAQRLTALFVDETVAQDAGELAKLTGRMARVIKTSLSEGCTEEELEAAIPEFVRRRLRNPWKLVELVVEAEQELSDDPAERPSARRRAHEWIIANGWPTGARLVRGQVGSTYVYDPLGLEPLPREYEGWPHPRVSFEEIVQALSEEE
jgi:hypothetical protein